MRLYARPQPPDSCGSNAARAFGTACCAASEPARDCAEVRVVVERLLGDGEEVDGRCAARA